MSYLDKIKPAELALQDYKAKILDAFVSYLIESGTEAQLRTEFGDKTFAELRAFPEEFPIFIGPNYSYSVTYPDRKLHDIEDEFQTKITNNDSGITHFIPKHTLSIHSDKGPLAQQVPEFAALSKAIECIVPKTYTYAQTEPIFLWMLDCLSVHYTTRFDAEIREYQLNKLTEIRQNQAEALEDIYSYPTICGLILNKSHPCVALKELINSLPPVTTHADEL